MIYWQPYRASQGLKMPPQMSQGTEQKFSNRRVICFQGWSLIILAIFVRGWKRCPEERCRLGILDEPATKLKCVHINWMGSPMPGDVLWWGCPAPVINDVQVSCSVLIVPQVLHVSCQNDQWNFVCVTREI